MKVANGYEYTAIMEKIAPKKLAMEGDPIGLQVGDLSRKVRKIMFTLDVLEEVVDEAIEKKSGFNYRTSSVLISTNATYRHNN